MLSSITIFATGSAMCGAANDIATLIGGRTIQGFGVAGINILAEVILSDLLPMRLRDRDQFMGFIFLFTVLGSLLGPFLGGIIIGGASWRWIFLLNLPFCGFCLGLLFISLKPAKARSNDDRTPLQRSRVSSTTSASSSCAHPLRPFYTSWHTAAAGQNTRGRIPLSSRPWCSVSWVTSYSSPSRCHPGAITLCCQCPKTERPSPPMCSRSCKPWCHVARFIFFPCVSSLHLLSPHKPLESYFYPFQFRFASLPR